MAIEVEKSSLSINQTIANKTEITTIEGECIVPDVKPDIMEIIDTSGIVSVYKKEISDGKIRIDGAVSTYVIYSGNDDKNSSVRSLNHVLDFSQIIIVPEVKEGMQDTGNISLESISCTIINERKIKIKANLLINTNVSSSAMEEFVSNIQIDNLQKIDNKVNVNTIFGVGSTKTSINETVSINNTDILAEILRANLSIVNIDTKVSYNKILVKSDVLMSILYVTEDGRYNVVKSTFPIMGFIDMKDVSDDNLVKPNIEIKNLIIKPNGSQEHTISVDIEIGIDVSVYGNKEIEVVKDMYSPRTNIAFNQKKIETVKNMKICKNTMNFSKKEYLDVGGEKVYDINSKLIITEVKPSNNSIDIKGNIQLNCIHSKNRMTGVESKKIDIPFEHKIPCDNINTNSKIEIVGNITNENYNIMAEREIDIRLDINFTAISYNNINIEIIENVEDTGVKTINPYNVVIYYTRKGDTLWKIAKEFRTTIAQIKNDNSLKDEKIQPDMQLFISRY